VNDEIQAGQSIVETLGDSAVSRRRLMQAGAGLALGAAVVGRVGSDALAQDATPEAALPVVPPEVEQYANDWPVAQGDLAATRFARGGQIDSSNVSTLGVAWELPLTATSAWGAITSNPIVQGDTVYIVDNQGDVTAIDRETGSEKWKTTYNVATAGPNGLAIGYGILVSVLGDSATTVALDPATGEELWSFQLANHNSLGITMAPFIYNGFVIVSTEPGGNTKGNYQGGANGVVYCLDVQTGITLWTWDTVEDDLWGDFTVNSGGGLWYPPSVDSDGVLYLGVANAAPWYPTTEIQNDLATRPGDNDYANNLVALDPAQGKVLWNVNMKPRDLFDLDNQQTPIVADVEIGGEPAKIVITTGKHGYVAGVHRESGGILWLTPVGTHKNDGLTNLPDDPIEIFPGTLGGVESPAAYKDGVVYVACLNFPSYIGKVTWNYAPGLTYSDMTSNLVAIDAVTGQIIWDVALDYGIAGPGPVISGDLLFTGSLDGIVRAFSIVDGSQVWTSQTSAGLNAPFAIAGDLLLVPAGSIIAASPDSPETLPGYYPALIAYKLGATGTPTLAEASTSDSGDATPAAAAEGEVVVEAYDLGFTPNAFTIPANTDVTLTLKNTGVLIHDLVSDAGGFATSALNGGEEESITINLAAGEYAFICSIEGHASAGMVGTVTVE